MEREQESSSDVTNAQQRSDQAQERSLAAAALRAQMGDVRDKHLLCSAEILAEQRALSARATRVCAEVHNQVIILERKHDNSHGGRAVRPEDVAGDVAGQRTVLGWVGGGLERRVLNPVGEYLRFPYASTQATHRLLVMSMCSLL